jgi:hypothetical protein
VLPHAHVVVALVVVVKAATMMRSVEINGGRDHHPGRDYKLDVVGRYEQQQHQHPNNVVVHSTILWNGHVMLIITPTTTDRIEGGVVGEDGHAPGLTSPPLTRVKRMTLLRQVVGAEPYSLLLPVLYQVHVLTYGYSSWQVHVPVL